jgi:hypothetical protein
MGSETQRASDMGSLAQIDCSALRPYLCNVVESAADLVSQQVQRVSCGQQNDLICAPSDGDHPALPAAPNGGYRALATNRCEARSAPWILHSAAGHSRCAGSAAPHATADWQYACFSASGRAVITALAGQADHGWAGDVALSRRRGSLPLRSCCTSDHRSAAPPAQGAPLR